GALRKCDWIYRKQDNFESAAWTHSRPFFPLHLAHISHINCSQTSEKLGILTDCCQSSLASCVTIRRSNQLNYAPALKTGSPGATSFAAFNDSVFLMRYSSYLHGGLWRIPGLRPTKAKQLWHDYQQNSCPPRACSMLLR